MTALLVVISVLVGIGVGAFITLCVVARMLANLFTR